ncbi:hypothetical protein [Allocoleopsis sp.]|uniref:hypothetical protein n=1 Tax=Allocoleopsis sp. TaxID=3088169 RepID=UPI002FD5D56A
MDCFEVFYDKDKPNADRQESVIVRRVARSRYSELKGLLSKLMANFLYFGCSRGELCDASNDRVWSDIRKVAEMLPLDGGGALDLDRIDDIQILEIFFTDDVVEVRGRVEEQPDEEGVKRFKPGKITALHGFNFLDYHQKCRGIYGIGLEMANNWVREEDKIEEKKLETNGKVKEPESVELATPMPS